MTNIELLEKARQWANEENDKPEEESQWGQQSWVEMHDCGTSYCIAGYIVAQQYGNGVFLLEESAYGPFFRGSYFLTPNGNFHKPIETEARELLGITGEEADSLFDGSNDIDAINNIVDGLIDQERERTHD